MKGIEQSKSSIYEAYMTLRLLCTTNRNHQKSNSHKTIEFGLFSPTPLNMHDDDHNTFIAFYEFVCLPWLLNLVKNHIRF